MDDAMQKEYFTNTSKYIDEFEVGGRYNMVLYENKIREWIEEVAFGPINDWWFLKWINWERLWSNYIFIIQKWEIKMLSTTIKDIYWKPYKHSDLAWNKNVDFAWLITFNRWKISVNKWISNNTWHYKSILDKIDIEVIKKAFDDIWYDTTNIYDLIHKKF